MIKKNLIKLIEGMSKKQRLKILQYLSENKLRIHESADGCRINLDAISKRKYTALVKFVRSIDIEVEEKYQI